MEIRFAAGPTLVSPERRWVGKAASSGGLVDCRAIFHRQYEPGLAAGLIWGFTGVDGVEEAVPRWVLSIAGRFRSAM